MSFFASLVGAIFSSLLQTFLKAWQGERERADLDGAHERAGAAETALETQQTIAETADARSALDPLPDDPDALARSLRSRKTVPGGGDSNRPGARHAGGA